MVNIHSYFPFNLAPNKQLIIQTEASQGSSTWFGLTHKYTKNTEGIQLDDYGPTGWLDTWKFKLVNNCVIEWSDVFPTHTIVFAPTRELHWGGDMEVGDEITQILEVQSGVTGPGKWGTEVLKLEAMHPTFTIPAGTFSDVIQMNMFQSFCKTSTCDYPNGQNTWITRHWFAPSLGIIQTEYLTSPDTPTYSPPRIDYATNIVKTWKS